MQIMYGIVGQRRLLEWEAAWLPGYGGAQPVRVGNAAHAQLQLDVYGELIDAFHQWRMAKLELDQGTWALECAVLEHLAEVWDKPDHGIWERRGDGKHYVSSKVMTWVAFDRAIKSAEKFGLEGPLDRWKVLRDTICRDVCEKGFDPGAECVRRILWLATAGRQHPAAAGGGFPSGLRPARQRHARRRRDDI